MKKKKEVIKGFKGFSKGLQCRGFQYEIDKEYTQKSEVELCQNGFHFCENPLSVLNYYPIGSEFAEVESRGEIKSDGDKSVTNKLYIKAKLTLPMFIKASVAFIRNKASEKGSYAHSATSGNDAHSATSGSYAHSATSGNDAHSATSGNDAIACAVGRKAAAKGSLGCWVVLAEWKEGNEYTDAKPINVKAIKVDGVKIKADTFYVLKDGEFVEQDQA